MESNLEQSDTIFEDGFDVECELGRGSTGVVYKIVAKKNALIYAMKKISVRSLTPSQRALKLKEIQNLRLITTHENIIRNVDVRLIERDLYILMEYAENGDLAVVRFYN